MPQTREFALFFTVITLDDPPDTDFLMLKFMYGITTVVDVLS
jgi:hypothetical protein